ncbi:MAG: T9SS C-terminal target domain-containing protein [Calditrichaeota bacterium]|nr:MAG: T9SS C-terminal target domain-containing protein [Calditrichota bacterium]
MVFAEKEGSRWNGLTLFRTCNSEDRNPVVTAWDANGQRDVAIAYQGDVGEIHYILRQNGDWSDVTVISTDGNYPALTAIFDTPHLIWTETQTLPYRILHSDQLLSPLNAGSSPPHSREITFRLSKALPDSQRLPVDGNVTVEIADPIYTTAGDSQRVEPLYNDSLLTPYNGFQYRNVVVNDPSARLRIPVMIRADSLTRIHPSGKKDELRLPFLALRLKDGRQHTTLLTLHTYLRDIFNSDSLSSFVITDTFTVALDAFVNREVQVEGQLFFKKRNLKAVVAEVYDLRNRGNRMQQPLLARAGNTSLPERFELLQNYPNPFNPTTTISFDLPHATRITLHVFDVSGRQVRKLADGQYAAGSHQVVWDGRDDNGVQVASGVYFYRLSTGSGFVATRKMVLLR